MGCLYAIIIHFDVAFFFCFWVFHVFEGHFPLWFCNMSVPCLLNVKGCWVVGMKGQVEDDMVVVCVILSTWVIVYFCMGDCFVENPLDLVTFISACNESFEKNLCLLEFVIFRGAKGKNSKQCAVYNPQERPWWVGRMGGGGGGGCIDVG